MDRSSEPHTEFFRTLGNHHIRSLDDFKLGGLEESSLPTGCPTRSADPNFLLAARPPGLRNLTSYWLPHQVCGSSLPIGCLTRSAYPHFLLAAPPGLRILNSNWLPARSADPHFLWAATKPANPHFLLAAPPGLRILTSYWLPHQVGGSSLSIGCPTRSADPHFLLAAPPGRRILCLYCRGLICRFSVYSY